MAANSSSFVGALRDLELQTPHASRLVLSSPWGAVLPSTGKPGMYIVTRGTAWIRTTPDARPIELRAGDVALLPRGSAHALGSEPGAPTPPFSEFCVAHGGSRGMDMIAGGRGPEAHLDTFCFDVGNANALQLLNAVPALCVLPQSGRTAWTSHVSRALSALLECREIESSGAPAKLSEVLFGIAVHDILPGSISDDGRPDAVVTIARVLIHANLAHPWTVPVLARRVGVSKSAFHDRFARATGMSPIDYLSTARMRRASEMLADRQSSVQEVAEAVGYRSASSFAVAFRRWCGRTPSDVRDASRSVRDKPRCSEYGGYPSGSSLAPAPPG